MNRLFNALESLRTKGLLALNQWGQQLQLPFMAILALTIFIYALTGLFYGDDPHDQSRLVREGFTWLLSFSLVGLYTAGFFRLQSENAYPLRHLVVATVLVTLAALLITPFHSTDLYGYINRGWQQLAYGLNPYITVIDDIPNWGLDPMIKDHWVNNPCPYGFLFALMAKGFCVLGQGNITKTVLVVKFFNGLAHFGIAALLWWVGKCLNRPRPDLTAYLYAWNPLILIHHLANGHNDIWMGFCLTVMGAAILCRWFWMVLPALLSGILIKYLPVVLVPVVLVFLGMQVGFAALVGYAAITLMLLALLSAPYWAPLSAIPWGSIGQNATLSHQSLHSILLKGVKELTKLVPTLLPYRMVAQQGIKGLLWMGFLGVYAQSVWRWFQSFKTAKNDLSEDRALLTLQILVGLLVLTLTMATSKFYPWYWGSVIPLALLLVPGNALRHLVILVSVLLVFSITVLGQAHVLNYLLPMGLPVLLYLPAIWRKLQHANK